MKKICKEQYEKDFKEMFKLDKNGLMTDIDCYVSNLESKINNLQSKIDKAIECLVNNIDLEIDDFTKIDLGCDVLKILDLDKYNEFLKEDK